MDPSTLQEATRDGHARQAAVVLDRALARLDDLPRSAAHETPEARANRVRDYLTGMVEGIAHADQLVSALSREITSTLCGQPVNDEKLISLAYVGQADPRLIDAKAYECVFKNALAARKEDPGLWYMLDAWRHSGSPESPTVAALRGVASDPRTLRRLASAEHEARTRGANRPVSASMEPGR